MISLITNFGQIDIKLDYENTPLTSENFLQYAKNFYNDTIFHRVISGFVVQGGGFTSGMTQKKTNSPIPNEAKTGLKNYRGTIAMARTGDPDSATSQFFINLKDNHFLDYTSETSKGFGYCVFGKIINGLDVVDKIAQVATTTLKGHQDVPIKDIIIEKVLIDES